MSIPKRVWLIAAGLLALTNVVRALYFDWSDISVHMSIAALCTAVAMRWSKAGALAAALVLLTSVLAFAFSSKPSDWAEIEVGDPWSEVRRSLGAPVHEASNLAQARALMRGFSSPSPFRFRQTGPVAIYVRGENALWVFHNGEVVVATYVGGS
jgi:hypothetical protein